MTEQNFNIIVTRGAGVRRDDLHDLDARIEGVYLYAADDSEAALDLFHANIAIKVLDDFVIVIEPSKLIGGISIQPEQDMDFIAEAARDFMELMEADQAYQEDPDPDTAADIVKIREALERLGHGETAS